MDNDAIMKLQDVIRNNNLGKILNTIAVILDRSGNAPEGAAQMVADLVPYIDLADDTVTPEDEEIDEASTLGTGTSISTGASAAYATPLAFGDNKNKKRKSYMGYKEI